MKKMKWIGKLAGIVAAGALISFTMSGLLGCNQTLDDEDERSTTGGSTPGASSGGTGVKIESLTAAKTLSATGTTGYTVKLGCDGSAMKVTSVKYNGSQLMPANTAYTLENLSFNGVNVGGLSADTWTVEYAYTMTKVGESAWTDYNFEIADGNTENGALGYWSLRYDNYAVGYLKGYHEYGTWQTEHVGDISSSDAAYGGHWYGMANKIENFDHSQTLNKSLVMKIEKTDSAFVITITSDGTEIWKCTNDKAVSTGEGEGDSGNAGESSGLYIGLGGENTFNLTAVEIDGTAQTIKHTTLKPSAWNAISEFETVQLKKGSSVSYSFTQAEVGSGAWNTWALAVYDNATVANAKGTFLRGDNWLNKSTEAGFKSGLWSEGGVTAGGTYSNDYTYETAGKSLKSTDNVVIKVEYSDTGLKITETINGTLAYTTEGKLSSSGSTDSGSGETGNGGEVETTIPDASYTAKLDGTDIGITIVGNGSYVDDEKFGKVFKNDGSAQRTSYLQLPTDTLQHSATSKEMTIGFWVNANGVTTDWLPMFAAYHAASNNNANTFPMFMCQSRCKLQVNCAGWCDFTLEQKTDGIAEYSSDVNVGYSGWKDSNWHYYTCSITETKARIYIDGVLIVEWTIDGTSDGQVVSGLFANAGDTALSYVCLGGNQAWDWADNDAPYSFAKFSIWNTALSQEQIQAVVAAN